MSDADDKVVIEQRLLKIDECFVYRIPPMRSADGHRADDWNLATPLATCSLVVATRDSALCINIMAERPKPGAPEGATETYLFAQSNVAVDLSNPSHTIEHWVNLVIDSSRYFAVRIKDAKSGREAFVGVGFRERTDATNFRMSIEDYINSLKREEKAALLQKQFEQSSLGSSASGENRDINFEQNSSLSLKEGEKLHITMKSNRANPNRSLPKSKRGMAGLKKPPPPPGATPAKDDVGDQTSAKNDASDVDWGDFEG